MAKWGKAPQVMKDLAGMCNWMGWAMIPRILRKSSTIRDASDSYEYE